MPRRELRLKPWRGALEEPSFLLERMESARFLRLVNQQVNNQGVAEEIGSDKWANGVLSADLLSSPRRSMSAAMIEERR